MQWRRPSHDQKDLGGKVEIDSNPVLSGLSTGDFARSASEHLPADTLN